MSWDKVIRQAAEELGIPYQIAHRAYMSTWKFMGEKVSGLKLTRVSNEEFSQLRPNFNMPSFGKFGVTEKRFKHVNRRQEIMRNWRKNHAKDKENQADI